MARKSFHDELDELKNDLLKMGTLVEKAIHDAVKSLAEKDLDLARQVVDGDDLVDRMELKIEEKCLTLLALQQPMARDLRVIGTAMKIITDLERMADHAVNIARITIRLKGQPFIKPLIDIPRMADLAQRMLRDGLTAYIEVDPALAGKMGEMDHEVDHLYSQIFRELLVYMMEDPRNIQQATHLLFVGQHLERIADHATNLGEWVIYMATGERQDLND